MDKPRHPIIPLRTVGECHADACDGGRKPCPCPDACHVPTDERERAMVWRLYVVAVMLVATLAAMAVGWPA